MGIKAQPMLYHPSPPAWVPLGNRTPSFSTKYPLVKEVHFLFQQVFWRKRTEKAACPGSTLPVGAKIVEKAEKKSSGLGFVKVVHFLLGAKFAELRPGKGGS